MGSNHKRTPFDLGINGNSTPFSLLAPDDQFIDGRDLKNDDNDDGELIMLEPVDDDERVNMIEHNGNGHDDPDEQPPAPPIFLASIRDMEIEDMEIEDEDQTLPPSDLLEKAIKFFRCERELAGIDDNGSISRAAADRLVEAYTVPGMIMMLTGALNDDQLSVECRLKLVHNIILAFNRRSKKNK